ncbi:hypothetical protein HGRIS_000038 [Hohenbuehelia grisea]|uniref:Uncharacterized protein n=1 Tax=Hohenbuehelia grisea TaxID=104357 RepID=A0ABR3JPV5_9AGAR
MCFLTERSTITLPMTTLDDSWLNRKRIHTIRPMSFTVAGRWRTSGSIRCLTACWISHSQPVCCVNDLPERRVNPHQALFNLLSLEPENIFNDVYYRKQARQVFDYEGS